MRSQVIRMASWRTLAACACALWLAGCATRPAPPATPLPELPPVYTQAGFGDLPGWQDDPVSEAWPAFEAGCRTLTSRARDRATWQRVCDAAAAIDPQRDGAVRAFFERHFTPYRLAFPDGRDRGLVTGYYEPLLDGSRTRTARFGVPLLAPPADLVTVDLASLYPELAGKRVRGRLDGRRVVPYWSRHEIEQGRLGAAPVVLAWVDDPLEAFLLAVQGSGRIALPDGAAMRVGYADQNGHPYRAIGRVLVERGELTAEQATLDGIRAWARAHPADVPALLDENPSYVFFREVPPPPAGSLEARIDGPIGSLGVPLLAKRTLAVDPRAVPLGAPVFVQTRDPVDGTPLARLTLAQDTGGAIRGAVRADFFWGFGAAAGQRAGAMRGDGALWLLWPNDTPLPSSPAR